MFSYHISFVAAIGNNIASSFLGIPTAHSRTGDPESTLQSMVPWKQSFDILG